jgi:hypothetical protein
MEAIAVMEIVCDKIFSSYFTAKVAKFYAKSATEYTFITTE